MKSTATDTQHKAPGLQRLLAFAAISRWWLVLGFLLFVLYSLLIMSPYVLVFYHINTLLNNPASLSNAAYLDLQQAVVIVFCLTLLLFLLAYLGGLCFQYTAHLLTRALRRQIGQQISGLPSELITSTGSVSVRRIIHDDIDIVADFIGQQLPEMIKAICIPLLIFSGLFFVDWRLALISVLPLPLLLVLIPYSVQRKKKHDLRQGFFDSRTAMDESMSQFITALPVIKSFALTVSSFDSYSRRVEDFRTFMHLWINTMIPHWSRYFSFLVNASLPVLALGLWLYTNNGIAFNVLLLFILLGSAAVRPLFALANSSSQLAVIRDIDSRLQTLLHTRHTATSNNLQPENNSFVIDRLSYSYGNQQVLHEISAEIREGQCTALVGPSGSGKTTCARLLAGLLNSYQGSIQLGGIELSQLNQKSQSQAISFAFQEAMLFGISLSDNIRLGLQATDADIEEAAKKAQCHDFISALPHAYATIISEHTSTLSGGQIQRIQLARALLKNAPIVILDEATAFTDAENEQHIQQALTELAQCRNLIVISHRLRSIIHADTILVLDQGRLVGSGKHTQLLANCSVYQQLWHRQNSSHQWHVRGHHRNVRGVRGQPTATQQEPPCTGSHS